MALSFSLSFRILLAILPACPRARRPLHICFFPRPILKLRSVRTALMKNGALNHNKIKTFTFPNVDVSSCVLRKPHFASWSQDFGAVPYDRT